MGERTTNCHGAIGYASGSLLSTSAGTSEVGNPILIRTGRNYAATVKQTHTSWNTRL